MKDFMMHIALTTYDSLFFKNSYYDDINGLKIIFKQFLFKYYETGIFYVEILINNVNLHRGCRVQVFVYPRPLSSLQSVRRLWRRCDAVGTTSVLQSYQHSDIHETEVLQYDEKRSIKVIETKDMKIIYQ